MRLNPLLWPIYTRSSGVVYFLLISFSVTGYEPKGKYGLFLKRQMNIRLFCCKAHDKDIRQCS